MKKNLRDTARTTLLCLACVIPALAGAQSQFFVQVVGVPGTITCAPDGVIATGGTFALNWNVPTSELDATLEGRVNGNLVVSTSVMIPGSSGTVPGDLNVSFPTEAFPYTFTVRLIPTIASIPPTGISFFCPAAGPGTNFMILSNAVVELPASSLWGLVWTSALLVILGTIVLRRRARLSS